jgi:hypothetical protein
MQNYKISRRSPKRYQEDELQLPQQTASTGPEYPPVPSLGHQEVSPFEKKNYRLVTGPNGCPLASKSLSKIGGRKSEVKGKSNEKTRRKTPDPASTGSVDPDQRIHNGPK